MPTLAASLDFAKYEGRNLRAHQLGTNPASPVTGQLFYNTTDNTLYWWDGTIWQSAKGGAPGGAAGGDLSGTYPNPQIATGVIVDTDVAAANKDGVAATPSLRTLGAGAQQACGGTDARLTNARTPTAHASTHQPGGSDPMAVDAAAATGSLRTIGTGAAQALAGNTRLDQIIAPTAAVSMNSQKLTNVLDPTAAQDAATKLYVDNTVQGLDAKASVRAATTANITLSAAQTVDGVALVAGDRCLVKNQTASSQNGIYTVQTGAWTRATDVDTWTELISAYTWVESGTTLADTGWVCTVDPGGTLDTTGVTWVQFNGGTSIIGGAGLVLTGNTLDVGGTANRITVAADTVDIAATYVGQT